MPDDLITQVGGCLLDKEMNLFDKLKNVKVVVTPAEWTKRDRPFAQIAGAMTNATVFVDEGVELPEQTPISSQGSIGSCVANATADMFETLMGLAGRPVPQLSRLFLFWCARDLVGTTADTNGSYIRAAMHQLKNIGIIEEKHWPYDIKKATTPPKLSMYTMASSNRIDGFYRLDGRGSALGDQIEKCIRAMHPVVFGTVVGDVFKSFRGGGDVLDTPSKWSGRHAMVVVGVRKVGGKRQFKWRNSWSTRWGNRGYCWVTEGYMTSSHTRDVWCGTGMKPLR